MKILNYPIMQSATGNRHVDNTPNCRVRSAHQNNFQSLDRDTVMFGISDEVAKNIFKNYVDKNYNDKLLSKVIDTIKEINDKNKAVSLMEKVGIPEKERNNIIKYSKNEPISGEWFVGGAG